MLLSLLLFFANFFSSLGGLISGVGTCTVQKWRLARATMAVLTLPHQSRLPAKPLKVSVLCFSDTAKRIEHRRGGEL